MGKTLEEIDFGPLAPLIGTWKGDKGMDVAPEPEGPENSPYYETIVIEAVGEVENAQIQNLVSVRYHQVVQRKSNDEVFHDEIGYWMWDPADNSIFCSLLIPRAMGAMAEGKVEPGAGKDGSVKLIVSTPESGGIFESPFMKKKASTKRFRREFTVENGTLSYHQTTVVDIYGKTFDHTDENTLKRV